MVWEVEINMFKYNIDIEINEKYDSEVKLFLRFLQNASKKHLITFHYKTIKKGSYQVKIGSDDKLKSDAFFQELIFNKALYYYSCTLKSKDEIVRHVIKPLFQEIINTRFQRTHEKLLTRHILGKITTKFVPGDIFNESGHRYENLFFRWDVGILSDYDFIKDLDDLLTSFMLQKSGHQKGEKSPKFSKLVDICHQNNLFFSDRDIKKTFNKIHSIRTKGLHRLEKELKKEYVLHLASITYNYFQYYDDYLYSQNKKTIKSKGKWYRKIKYGYEKWLDENGQPYVNDKGEPYDSYEQAKTPCHDCGVLRGQIHVFGCDIEQCPVCKGQKLGCGCEDYDDG